MLEDLQVLLTAPSSVSSTSSSSSAADAEGAVGVVSSVAPSPSLGTSPTPSAQSSSPHSLTDNVQSMIAALPVLPAPSSEPIQSVSQDGDTLQIANTLLDLVENHEFAPGEKLNIIDHSHAGNVTKEFTQIYDGKKKIDTLVFLGTPHRNDYQLDFSDLGKNAHLINVYDKGDWLIQPILGAGLSGSLASQRLEGAVIIPIKQTDTFTYWNWQTGQIITTNPSVGWLDSHTNLDSAPVWNSYVRPNLNFK
jgi:hypothetical protein